MPTMSHSDWPQRLPIPLIRPSQPKPLPPAKHSRFGLQAPGRELRKKEIHVISNAIAKAMANNPHTI